MVKDELSELEIKLINATRKFLSKSACSIELWKYNEQNTSSITIRGSATNTNFAWLCYSGNAEEGKIKFYGKEYPDRKEKYKSFIIQEIPEIKDRIE